MPVRDKGSVPKVRRILDAAAAVFARRGFSEARMDDVAGEAGVSKGGLYLHFKSKEDLFDALVGYVVALEMRKLERARESGQPVAERLVDFFQDAARDMMAMERFFPLFIEVFARATHSATVRRMIQRYVDASAAEVSALIAVGIERGELRPVDPDEVGLHLVCLLEGLCLVWGIRADFDGLPDAAGGAVRLLLDGVRVQPGTAGSGAREPRAAGVRGG